MAIDPTDPLTPPPGHIKARKGLRVGGAILLSVGAIVFLIGFSEFVMAFVRAGDGLREPSMGRMILMLPGLLMVGIGLQMCMVGWAGAIARYGVREGAPAASEGFNRVTLGSREGIRAAAGAIAEGLRESTHVRPVPCPACGSSQDADARFCDDCGHAMPTPGRCPDCGAPHDADARFCAGCGRSLAPAASA